MSSQMTTTQIIGFVHEYKQCFKASGINMQIMPLHGEHKNPKFKHAGGVYKDEDHIYKPETWIENKDGYCNFGWLMNNQVFCIDLDGFGEDDATKKASANEYYEMMCEKFPDDIEVALIEKTKKGYHLIWKKPELLAGLTDHTNAFRHHGMPGVDIKTCSAKQHNGHTTNSILAVYPSNNKQWIDGHNPLQGSLFQFCSDELANWILSMIQKPKAVVIIGELKDEVTPDMPELIELLPKLGPETYEIILNGGDWDLWMKVGRGIINICGKTAGYPLWVQHCSRASNWSPDMEQKNMRYWQEWSTVSKIEKPIGIGTFRFLANKDKSVDDELLFLIEQACDNPIDQVLMAKLGAKILAKSAVYNTLTGCWCVWSGTTWKESCELPCVMNILSDKVRPLLDNKISQVRGLPTSEEMYTLKMKKEDIKKIEQVKNSFCNTTAKHIIERMTDMLSKSVVFDSNPYLFGLLDVVLDLKTNSLRPYRLDDYITLNSPISKAMLDAVTVEQSDNLNAIIDQILPNKDIREHVLYLDALTLNGHRRDILVSHNGSGANGKTLIKQLRARAVGSYATIANASLITDRLKEKGPQPEVLKLKGKRGLLISEPNANASICTDNIKLLLGGDSISARGLYERRATEFVVNSGIDLLCNKKLNLDSQDGGVQRRVLDIYYDSKFVSDDHAIDPAKNIYLKNREYESDSWLNANSTVFLKLLIEMHWKYMQLNKIQYQKPVPKAIIERTDQWLRDSNPFLAYLDDNLQPCGCTIERCKDGHVHSVHWKVFYEMFCRSQEYGNLNKAEKRNLSQKQCRELLATTKIYNSFTNRDHPSADNRCIGKYENCFIGFTLKDQQDEEVIDCAI